MTDRHILFSASMVRALLGGTKTQTRRMFKPRGFEFYTHPVSGDRYNEYRPCRDGTWDESRISGSGTMRAFGWGESLYAYLPHAPGDRLWVKETWRPFPIDLAPWDIEVAYAADGERRIIKDGEFGDNDWTMPKAAKRGNVSPLFMPRWASRLTLAVTDVRVERLQDISHDDAIADGVEGTIPLAAGRDIDIDGQYWPGGPQRMYRELWNHINGPGAWEANPWVVAYTFTVHRGNIDGSR